MTFCCTLGHENVVATLVGTFDDGETVEENVYYCDECAKSLAGEFTPYRLTGWGEVAFLPAGKYHVEKVEDGWRVYSGNADGSYS